MGSAEIDTESFQVLWTPILMEICLSLDHYYRY
jgi:hypothetical protein